MMPLCHTLAQKTPTETSKLLSLWALHCAEALKKTLKLCPVSHMDVRAISHMLVKPALSLYSLDKYRLMSCCLLVSLSHAVCIALHYKAGHVSSVMSSIVAMSYWLCSTFSVSALQNMSCDGSPVTGLVRLVLGVNFPFVCDRYWNTLPQFISHIGKATTVTSSSGATETCLSSSSSSAANETYADPLANIGASGATSTAVMSVGGLIGAVLLCMLLL